LRKPSESLRLNSISINPMSSSARLAAVPSP
jgi:hypothetical protein